MNTKTNFIMFSGPSGVGKSMHMRHLRRELEQYGYTVESHMRFYVEASKEAPLSWKIKIFKQAEKQCESRFCLIEVCTADQGVGMEITFRDFLGPMDLLNARMGIADFKVLGYESEP